MESLVSLQGPCPCSTCVQCLLRVGLLGGRGDGPVPPAGDCLRAQQGRSQLAAGICPAGLGLRSQQALRRWACQGVGTQHACDAASHIMAGERWSELGLNWVFVVGAWCNLG